MGKKEVSAKAKYKAYSEFFLFPDPIYWRRILPINFLADTARRHRKTNEPLLSTLPQNGDVCGLCLALGQYRRAKKGGNPHAVIAPLPHYLKGIELPEHSQIRSFLFPSYIASKRNAPHLLWRIRYTTQSSWKQHCINWSFYKAK